MQALDYAIDMEKDGETYYRQLAAKTTDPGLASILKLLANAELRHQKVLQSMKQDIPEQLQQDTVIQDTKNLFRQMLERKDEVSVDSSQIDLYRRAQELETKSRDFYQQKATDTSDPKHKSVLLSIAEEEQKHYQILQNLVDLISHAEPGGWLESAEWHHLDEY